MITTTLLLTAVPALQQAPTPSAPRVVRTTGLARATSGGRTPVAPAAPSSPQPFVSSGSYNQASFNYVDPFGPDFHPLGTELFTANVLEESVLIGDGTQNLDDIRRDDSLNGAGVSGDMPRVPSNGRRFEAASGDLRGDGTMQIVAWEAPWLRVRERGASGDFVIVHSERISSHGRIHFDCADVDGDGRDEIVCAVGTGSNSRQHEVWVYDDLVDGPWGTGGTMPRLDRRVLGTGNTTLLYPVIVPAQLDGDGREELFAAFALDNSHDIYAVDDLQAGLATIAEGFTFGGDREDRALACAADTDADGIDELVVGARDYISIAEISGSTFTLVGSRNMPDSWYGLTAADYDGNGVDEFACIEIERSSGGSPWNPTVNQRAVLTLLEREPQGPSGIGGIGVVLEREVFQGQGPEFGPPVVASGGLVSLEDDGDGREEIRGFVGVNDSGSEGLMEFRLDGSSLAYNQPRYFNGPSSDEWFMVAGEDDREKSVLRYTGVKELQLGAPLPIVVMEAVPTKEGIQQNYGASQSTFSSASSIGTSYSSTAALSIGVTGGFTSPSLFGVFEAEATATISGTVANTTGSSEFVRTFTTYGSDHDVHSVVFQGTLYHSYLYEVVRAADPAAIGAITSLNVPVATNEWKWTIDAYNAAFPNGRIEPSVVFAHSGGVPSIGDPTTYPTRSELEGVVTGASPLHTGWVGGSSTVGEGTAFNGFGLVLGSISTTSTERTLSVEVGVSFAAAGTVFGSSFGVSSTDVFTVETSTETDYAAQIGDIAPADYGDWSYTAGMVVYQDRISGVYPFQVIRYWTDPTGVAYP